MLLLPSISTATIDLMSFTSTISCTSNYYLTRSYNHPLKVVATMPKTKKTTKKRRNDNNNSRACCFKITKPMNPYKIIYSLTKYINHCY